MLQLNVGNVVIPASVAFATVYADWKYLEAELILKSSPRMSAVLSRRILADLLKQYANLSQYGLSERIDAFVKDTRHPLLK